MQTFLVVAALATAAAPPPTQGNPNATPIGSVTACRSVADSAARLACYDSAAAALDLAVTSKDLVVLSPGDVKETRRSLFGFSLPKLPFLGDRDQEETEITAKLKGARSLGYGKWRLVLEDGAVWETTEGNRDQVIPRVGTSVKIKRGVLGSYMINIDGTRGVKAVRIS